jgi:GT2 family glycosyltransferase
MTEPTASIVVLCHDQVELTRVCIESVRECTAGSYEIIVVDNGSTDGTRAYLEREKRRGIRVVRHDRNLGYGAGNNAGIARSRGRYVVLLNNDVVVTPGWLDRLVRVVESDPRIGLVGPVTNNVSGVQRLGEGHYSTLRGLLLWSRLIARLGAGRTQDVKRLVGFCLLIRREVVQSLSSRGRLFDESFGLGNYEDDDLCLRASLAGWRLVVALDCFVHHEGSRTYQALGVLDRLLAENRERFRRKWGALGDGYLAGL